MTWRAPMTTGEIADLINAILQSAVYDDRAIRAEIDAGHLRAQVNRCRSLRAGAHRRSIRVTQDEFLRWAATVLRDEEASRLRDTLAQAS